MQETTDGHTVPANNQRMKVRIPPAASTLLAIIKVRARICDQRTDPAQHAGDGGTKGER